ncbi:MAG: M15 family metallopeptidase [bacterium]|nr:M15 family metallopeptidase [bacterium]
MKKQGISRIYFFIIGGVVIFGLLAYGVFYFWSLSEELREEVLTLKESLGETGTKLTDTQKENLDLSEALVNEQSKNQFFESQIQDIFGVIGGLSGTVGTLQKLSQTDPELLKKYSKVYFLSEHYVPELLSIIDSKYIYEKDKPQQIHVKVASFLNDLLNAAEADNVNLRVVSAYRSFGTQASVKSGYTITYGSGANRFSADQGYSEHQLGTAVDFTLTETEDVFYQFEKTEGYQWLKDNVYKYGFILSYPPDNDYYQFEPWHWRFVGVTLATKLNREGLNFYEVSQRDIDEYLVSLFD